MIQSRSLTNYSTNGTLNFLATFIYLYIYSSKRWSSKAHSSTGVGAATFGKQPRSETDPRDPTNNIRPSRPIEYSYGTYYKVLIATLYMNFCILRLNIFLLN